MKKRSINTVMVTEEIDTSEVKNTYCSCRGPRVQFLGPTSDGSQPPVTPIAGLLTGSDHRMLLYMCGAHILMQAH